MTHIGDNIKRIRETRKLSQQDLADKSEVSKAQISRLESGSQNNPQILTLLSLATALGVTLEEIVYGSESEASSYLSEAIKNLPEEEQRAIKKMIKVWIITTQSELWEK